MFLAIPAALSVILNNAFRIVDQFVVQWLGTEAQAAIGSCAFVMIFFFAMYEVVSAGVGPLVARATGASDPEQRRAILGQGFVLACGMGLIVCLATGLGAPWITGLVGLEGRSAELLTTYLRWLAIVGLPLALGPLVDAAFISMGKVVLPMVLHGVATVLNLALSWLLIYQFDLGIAGAALGSGISRGVVVLYGMWVLVDQTQTGFPHLIRQTSVIRRIVRIGWPMAMGTAAYALVYWALLRVAVSPLDPDHGSVNAALGIGFSVLEGVSWPLFHGASLALASLVGRRLGAGEPEAAVQAAKAGFLVTTVLGLGATLFFVVGADVVAAHFTSDPQVYAQTVLYARVLAWSQLFVAWEATTEGVLAGAGDTRTVFAWSVPFNVLRVPLGWLLAFPLGMGAAGVWWAINVTTVAKALGKGMSVVRGRWKSIEV